MNAIIIQENAKSKILDPSNLLIYFMHFYSFTYLLVHRIQKR